MVAVISTSATVFCKYFNVTVINPFGQVQGRM